MDGELSEKVKSFFDGAFPIWPRPGRSWNSSAEKFHSPFGEDANAERRGAADRGEHRQAARAITLDSTLQSGLSIS
jgi:hypothetical protein